VRFTLSTVSIDALRAARQAIAAGLVAPVVALPSPDLLLHGAAREEASVEAERGDVLSLKESPEVLQLPLGGDDDVRLEQLAQLHPAQQFGQQGGVQRQRRRPALGQRAVALVHESPDVAEQHGCRERGRRRGLDVDEADAALGDP
jgi:hypothetical protein